MVKLIHEYTNSYTSIFLTVSYSFSCNVACTF